jgi:hypothetical protein
MTKTLNLAVDVKRRAMKKSTLRSVVASLAVAGLVTLASVPAGNAQTSSINGWAVALQATVPAPIGSETTALGATGELVDDADARAAALASGSVPAVGGANVLHATTVSGIETWAPDDEVSSEASLADLSLTVAGVGITAGFVMAQADAPVGGGANGEATLDELKVNGSPIVPSGAENQTISLPGLTLILNEVQRAGNTITVTALHVKSADGLVDVLVASATAGVD